MVIVCQKHGKEGLKHLHTPHVEKMKKCKGTCQFCNQKAEIKMFDSIPFQTITTPESTK
ncbi:hypothetical protein [Domibacillus mangrovi]|uniref:hypothetical protein n=1 Tax=Domibacillus mangrovi TaxID=1714354 RepID=UPI000A964367|nr:hypothetical protein [Domibacillus mangrovi]